MSHSTTPTERRRTPRRQPALGTVLRLMDLPSASGERHPVALVWNISLGGVSFLFPSSLTPGTRLRGELVSKRTGGISILVGLRVTHSVGLQTGDYLLGCQFEQAITPEQMSHFVDEALVGL